MSPPRCGRRWQGKVLIARDYGSVGPGRPLRSGQRSRPSGPRSRADGPQGSRGAWQTSPHVALLDVRGARVAQRMQASHLPAVGLRLWPEAGTSR